ncbi:MAG: adenylyltransferase/cytidyltransferase family protein [Dehalococcoidia bacterium]|nr:adenylyltransferase/cytidyltransferase family protein [Dehalococcoidia bacterium]
MKKKSITVAVSGAFDPIHVGHIAYLREAAKLGDRLVVILNNDNFLLRKKGFVFRPSEDRKQILESIKGVDEVIVSIDDDQTVCKTLELLKPDIFAKGGYRAGPESIPEAETCQAIGCKVVTNVGGGKLRSDEELDSKLKGFGEHEEGTVEIECPYCADHPILKERCLHCKGKGKVDVGKAD